jgi:predicted nucleotidyltransferase
LDLIQYAKERDVLLGRIVQTLEGDPRVGAAWLSGSFGRGEADEWSDLDLHLAVDDAQFDQFLEERELLYRRVGRPILIQENKASESQVGACYQLVMYPGPIEVDWNIGPASQAQRPLAFQMLVDRITIPIVASAPLTATERRAQADHWLTFFWAMAPIAVKLCGRGDARRAVKQTDLLTTAFIALWRLVSQPEGPDPILPATNRILEPELDARLPRVGPTIDPRGALDIVGELCQEVEKLHLALMALGAAIPFEVPADVVRLRGIAEEVLRRGDIQPRTYR